jgi:putative addiction module antidote
MTSRTKVKRIGGSLALIVPKVVVDSMDLKEGDEMFISSNQDGMNVSPFDPEFAAAMEDAREFMRSHKNAFNELSK